MKLLIINSWIHYKNKIGFENILQYLNIEYKYGDLNDINDYDIIYSPSDSIDTSKYKNKKFIFGPHFSVFPNNKLNQINNIYNNSIYILPSQYCISIWNNMLKDNLLPIKSFPFPVDSDKFKSIKSIEDRKEVFIYYKSRNPEELHYIQNFLNNKNITYKLFDYMKTYKEQEYMDFLLNSKYGIWIGRHESQGFALQEALSCDVPLFVWDVKSMNQEYGYSHDDIPATTIPYWDKSCGEYFHTINELENIFDKFINNLSSYKPINFILNNLDVKNCAKIFKNILNI